MADPREIFPILENDSNEGVVPKVMVDGVTDPSGENGMIGFAFKDSSGNVILPQLNDEGAIVVSSDAGSTLRANGELAAGSTSLVDVTNASITLTLGEVYSCISAVVSCRRDTLFQLVYVDDAGGTPTETVIEECIVGSGQYSFKMGLDKDRLDTTGGTGVQELKIKAQNFEKASSMRAALSANELPS